MPTPKQVSKIKQEWITKRKSTIDSKIIQLQEDIFKKVTPDFVIMAKNKKANVADLNELERKVKSVMKSGFPDVMKETVKASRAVGDLNQMYYSTLMDSNRLDEISVKTKTIIDKKLGIDEAGNIKKGGFVDRSIMDEAVQKSFIKKVQKLALDNSDVQVALETLRKFTVGAPENAGVVSQYYNSFAKDLINNIDRSNSNIYADDLDLNHFYFGGGLIKTSRQFCLKCNGKIFTREQADKWRDKLNQPDGPIWNEKVDGKYIPLDQMGGYGCLHSPDWITADLAEGNTKAQNKIAAERNNNFKNRHNL